MGILNLLTKLFSVFGTDKDYYIGTDATKKWNSKMHNRNLF